MGERVIGAGGFCGLSEWAPAVAMRTLGALSQARRTIHWEVSIGV
jgi:hypothetical protein